MVLEEAKSSDSIKLIKINIREDSVLQEWFDRLNSNYFCMVGNQTPGEQSRSYLKPRAELSN